MDKPNKPARKPQITNANYEPHGMKAMILGNNEPYDSEFKDEESHNMDEMEKISEGAKDEKASKAEKKTMNMEVDINEFPMGSITRSR